MSTQRRRLRHVDCNYFGGGQTEYAAALKSHHEPFEALMMRRVVAGFDGEDAVAAETKQIVMLGVERDAARIRLLK